MEQTEVETLVAELETRVDRLRALYDQYFMGIEKLEPLVPRKDVDRRIYVLRKEQIRNTGLRYRFNMILQRYNTFQMYWARIVRQIENGTYKRHMMRAQARFGDAVPGAPRRPTRSSAPPAKGEELAHELAHDIDDPFADDATLPPSAGPGSLDGEFGLLDDPLERAPSSTAFAAAPSEPPPPVPPPRAPAPSAPGLGPGARPVWRKAAPSVPQLPNPPLPSAPQASSPPPLPPRANTVPGGAPPRPTLLRPAAATAAPAAPTPPPQPPRPAAPAIPRPAAPTAPATSRVDARATPAAPPVPPRQPPPLPSRQAPAPPAPARAPSVERPAPTQAPATRPQPAAASDLPDDRVRQLYAQYVEEKRRRNESTAAITFDGLKKSLRESSAKLREKHGRPVDFEVAEKDGKTVIRPVVK